MILVSITGEEMRRYDTKLPTGLTHVGRLRELLIVKQEAIVKYFRENPNSWFGLDPISWRE